jgi:hypothetical protein
MAQSVLQRATGWMAGVRFPAGTRHFLFSSVQTSYVAHPASITMGSAAISSGMKRPELEADHSPTPTTEVKNGSAIPPLSHTSSWRNT